MNLDDRMQQLLAQIARALVEHPEAVKVHVRDGRRATRFDIEVDSRDRGQLIGKEGATIRSLRALATLCATRHRRRFEVEIPG